MHFLYAGASVIHCVNVTPENTEVLQLLDLLKEVTDVSELNGSELTKKADRLYEGKGDRV